MTPPNPAGDGSRAPQYTPTGTFILPRIEGEEPTPIDPLPHFTFFDRPTDLDLEAPASKRTGPVAIAPMAAPSQLDDGADWLRTTAAALPAVELDDVAALRPGDHLGPILIGGLLGAGGFAQVYSGRDTRTGQEVAVKILQPRHKSRRDVAARLVSEGLTLKKVRSIRGIVQIHDVLEDPDRGVYLVMEWIRGETLRRAMLRAGGRLPLALGLEVMIAVCQTLGLLAEWDVIHRDLKPDNIFLSRSASGELRVVILDLGCAKIVGGVRTSSNTAFNGTWAYVSPEQLGRGELTVVSDIYGLGCMAYEVFNGGHPFAERAARARAAKTVASEFAMASWHVLSSPPLPAHTPTVLWNVIARMLEKDPAVRYQSVLDVAAALTRIKIAHERGALDADDLALAITGGPKVRPPPKPLPAEDAPPPPDVRPRLAALDERLDVPSLLVVEGPVGVEGHRFAIGREVIIGRKMLDEAMESVRADILLPVGTVSARHCRLHVMTEGFAHSTYQVDDLKSLHSIEIAGTPATEGLLRPFMTLRLGPEVMLELHGPGVIPSGRIQEIRRAMRPNIAPRAQVAQERIDLRVSQRVDGLAKLMVASEEEWEAAVRRERAELGLPSAPTPLVVNRRTRRWSPVLVAGIILIVAVALAIAILAPSLLRGAR